MMHELQAVAIGRCPSYGMDEANSLSVSSLPGKTTP